MSVPVPVPKPKSLTVENKVLSLGASTPTPGCDNTSTVRLRLPTYPFMCWVSIQLPLLCRQLLSNNPGFSFCHVQKETSHKQVHAAL